jgi:hypothetical protein
MNSAIQIQKSAQFADSTYSGWEGRKAILFQVGEETGSWLRITRFMEGYIEAVSESGRARLYSRENIAYIQLAKEEEGTFPSISAVGRC